MPSSAAVLITAVVAFATLSSTYATRGVIVTAPRSMERNAPNKVHMSLYDVKAAGIVTIALKTTDGSKVIAEKIVSVEEGESEKVIKLFVPETTEYTAQMWANGTFETTDDYTFAEQDEVNFHSTNSKIIFIQTDKPLYKPGQQVKFRILSVYRDLRPLREGILADIWIEDPSRSRLAQWKNVSLAKEIVQYEFPLSEEPPLGSYTITVKMPDTSESTNFDVKEYVLPKYEVTITPPSYVLADAEIIPIKVCAKYTYGKLVQGTLKINNSLESYSWSSEKFPVFEIEDKINGCYNYDLNVSLIDSEFSYVYRRIEIFVQVTEDGTEVQRNGTATVQRSYDPMTLEFLVDYYRQYFKPGIPYYKKVKATKPDKTPAPEEEIEVCATISRQRVLEHWWATRKVKFCKNYTSDEDGIVLFQVPPQKTDTISLYLEAKSMKYGTTASAPGRPKLYQSQTSTSVQPYYSPSKSYILVQNSDDTFQCGTSQNLKVLYTAEAGKEYTFHYQVISKGEVVEKGTKVVAFSSEDDVSASMCKDCLSVNDVRTTLVPSEIEEGTTTEEDIDCSSGPIGATEIPVEINARLSPSFTLLLYYIREDDETVADSTQFQVDKCFQNKVEFRFGDEEKQPGAKTSFTLKASPNSLCGTKVVDKSITLLDSSDQLTKEKVFDALKRFDNQQYYQRNHCNDKFRKGGKDKMAQSMILPPRPWSSSQYADALTAFEDAGLVALSDLKMLTRPCSRGQGTSYDSYGGSIALASAGVRGGQAGPQRRPMPTTPARRTMYKSRRPAAASFDSAPESVQVSKVGSSATKSVVDIRSYFPETFLFDLLSVGEIGELISKVTLPHTITEWIGNAVCINEADGLGLSDTASIRGFQAFFLEFTLPYSLIRGEKATIPISIFNYLDKCIPVAMSISMLTIADNGTVMDEDSTYHDVCVCKTYTYKYTFTPLRVGTINITTSAESAQSSSVCGDQETADVVARDKATQPLKVEPEGFPQEKVESFLFCPEDYDGSTYVSKFELSTPDDVVEGSERAFIFLSGDIMGPAIDGLDRLVQLPTGCGEQNMALFTPNIVVLDYLKSTGKLTAALKEKATRNLQTGYQRELKYRHPDGSYSAFGVSDKEGSMWLSAFVLMSFSQAKPYIDIDEKDISRTEKWIVEKQQDDGCFPQVGKLFSQGMKGGIGSQGKESTAPLTSYVLIALLTSDYKNETVINGALTCIETDENLNPYKAALYGYTAALANKAAEADKYLEYLSQRVIREGDETYWKNVNASESIDVETAAYAIMTILKRKGDAGLAQTLSIVKHMTTKRNSNGGFISTQDTVVGLQAISLFASMISQDPVDLKVELTGGRLEETALITEDDKLVVKRFRVPDVPSTIEMTATGTGCGLIQAAVRYNTIRVPKLKFFSININATRSSECKKAAINLCVSYRPENQKSNMALVEIKMISGFAAIKETLDKHLEDPKTSLKRYEIENNDVFLYFDELSNDVVCIDFDVEEIFEVEDNKPATVKAYDYYAKEREESAAYSISGSC